MIIWACMFGGIFFSLLLVCMGLITGIQLLFGQVNEWGERITLLNGTHVFTFLMVTAVAVVYFLVGHFHFSFWMVLPPVSDSDGHMYKFSERAFTATVVPIFDAFNGFDMILNPERHDHGGFINGTAHILYSLYCIITPIIALDNATIGYRWCSRFLLLSVMFLSTFVLRECVDFSVMIGALAAPAFAAMFITTLTVSESLAIFGLPWFHQKGRA